MAGAELTSSGTLCTLVRYHIVFPASACEASSKGQVVSDWIEIQKDPKHIAREKQKASHSGGATKLPKVSVPTARAPLRLTN